MEGGGNPLVEYEQNPYANARVRPARIEAAYKRGGAVMRRKDKNLLNLVKKKKKAPAFQGKVEGGNAQRRADMKRQAGGRVPRPGPGESAGGPRVGEDIARRTEDWMRPKTEESFLKGRDYAMPKNYQDGGGISSVRRKPKPGESREPPPLTGPTEGLKTGGDSGGKWIGKARASMERRGTVGSLRKAMGAKEGQKIPTSSLEAKKAQAKRTGNTAMMRKVNFALNVRK